MYREPARDYCQQACPAGVDVPRYLRLVVASDYPSALAVIRESIPFPAVCGYVCPAPCEVKCRLASFTGSPEAIRVLKRFIADNAVSDQDGIAMATPPTGKKIAVVGSGPAGLTAAYYLARSGHSATVLETLPEAGGMMRLGIPAYRLPRKVLDSDIGYIKRAGVKVRTNTKINSVDELFKEGYHAVFLALGAHRGASMGIAGEDSEGVLDALSFLGQVNSGRGPELGQQVAVVGGGNSAVDAARTALRLDAREVTIVYRRAKEDMKASPEEVEQAIEEGVRIVFQTAPLSIKRENGRLKMECARTLPGKKGIGHGTPPQRVNGSEFTIETDNIIVAVGQEVVAPRGILALLSRDGDIEIDQNVISTSKPGVFAGGDCISRAGSVIEAIAAGKRAAVVINAYLGIEDRTKEPSVQRDAVVTPAGFAYPVPTASRNDVPLLPLADRFTGSPLVEQPLPAEAASCEARRCLQCDLPIVVDEGKCRACFLCELVCSLRFEKAFDPAKAAIAVLPVAGGDPESGLTISFSEKCDSCGLCVRYCPSGALSRQHDVKQQRQPGPVSSNG